MLLGVPGVLQCIVQILRSELSIQKYYRTYLWNRLLTMSSRSGCQTPVLFVLQRVSGVLQCIAEIIKSALASQCNTENAHGVDFGECLPEAVAEHLYPVLQRVAVCDWCVAMHRRNSQQCARLSMYYRKCPWNRLWRISTTRGCRTRVLYVLQCDAACVPGVLQCMQKFWTVCSLLNVL